MMPDHTPPGPCSYTIQNLLIQTAYQHIDGLTFNLLNQAKTLFTAICLPVNIATPSTARQPRPWRFSVRGFQLQSHSGV